MGEQDDFLPEVKSQADQEKENKLNRYISKTREKLANGKKPEEFIERLISKGWTKEDASNLIYQTVLGEKKLTDVKFTSATSTRPPDVPTSEKPVLTITEYNWWNKWFQIIQQDIRDQTVIMEEQKKYLRRVSIAATIFIVIVAFYISLLVIGIIIGTSLI